VSDQKGKPILDEQALERLLEAAFVLQQHNREQSTPDLKVESQSGNIREKEAQTSQPPPAAPYDVSKNDYTLTLAQIVETQRQIQSRHLDLESALSLIVERIVGITRAAGAGIGIVDGKKIRYRAAKGSHALPLGTELPVNKALCDACLRVGQVIRCRDVNSEFLVDVDECRRRGIQSLIAVPIYHDGEIAGALELYFANLSAFTEHDVHSCQLMAGLVTESFARDDELAWKKSLAAERATMLEALEKLKPNLAALMESPVAKESNAQETHANAGSTLPAKSFVCRKCGHELVAAEQFCGKCGTPRLKSDEPSSMQSKVASLWQMQQAKRGAEPLAAGNGNAPPGSAVGDGTVNEETQHAETLEEDLLASLQADLDPEAVDVTEESSAELLRRLTVQDSSSEADPGKEAPQTSDTETALVKSADAITWSSAAKARDFLEQLASGRNQSAFARFWNVRRGDIYLAVAVILVAVVLRWGIWSNHSVSATGGPTATAGHRRPAPNSDLSMLDKMLIGLGLAEAPDAPEQHGNPETQVWVDTHTALYYCPGTDLYGKTPKGKYTTQRDAQLDQFEPAYRKACD
jgi:putative methionine-R-sulfoxide reductase with GAF domain